MKRNLVLGVLAAVVLITGTAMADPITLTQGSFTATVNVVGNTATLTFGSGLNSYFTDQVAIHVADGASVTGGSAPSGWLIQNGNNSVNCDGTGEWFCATTSGSSLSFNGLSFAWNFTGGQVINPVSIQFAVCNSSAACAPGSSNFVTNFSQSGGTTQVPEPASMTLVGAGLLGIGSLSRRRKSQLNKQ
jgi:PEP-CTERM motif